MSGTLAERILFVSTTVAALLLLTPIADADEPEPLLTEREEPQAGVDAAPALSGESGALIWDVASEYRYWIEGTTRRPLGAAGELDGTITGHQVAELGGSLSWDWLEFHAGVRIFSGVLFGGPSCPTEASGCVGASGGEEAGRDPRVDDDFDAGDMIVPRALWFGFETPIGILRIGHQTSNWGLGILANDGSERPDAPQSPLEFFNDKTGGDLVERAVFLTRPLLAIDGVTTDDLAGRFVVGLGGDLVYRDENASLVDGDVAGQAVIVVGLRPDEASRWGSIPDSVDWEIGTYSVYRNQEDDDGDTLEIGAVDVFGRLRGELPGNFGVASVRTEAAWLFGETTRVESEGAGPGEPLDLFAFGLAAEALLELAQPRIDVGVRFGYASGDANADDDTLYRFTFDRNYKAGLVFFDHIVSELSAAARDAAIDPERSAVPPQGVDELPTGGSVAGALFLQPVAVVHITDAFDLAAGFLWARATAPLVDPVESFERGGVPTNAYGGSATEETLGIEFDLGLRYRTRISDYATIEARAEYGVFRFGRALEDEDGVRPEPVHYGAGRVGLYF